MKRSFKLWHSLLGVALLLIIEAVLTVMFAAQSTVATLILCIAIVGAVGIIYVATEVIEEVRGARHMLVLLSLVVIEFIIFFAFQYWFLLLADPGSFPTLELQPVALALHSVMVFVFNPLFLPDDVTGQSMLLINSFGALGLVLFLLQNIWQVRSKQI